MNSTQNFLPKLLPAVFLLLLSNALQAQFLQVSGGNTPPFTPQNLISNVFLGDGVQVTNITYNGNANAVGYFTGGTQSIGIERGIVMTSGRAESGGFGAIGCNETGNDFASSDNAIFTNDVDLAALTTAGIRDLAVYTITFIPTSDTLRFRYCFGSEEYPEYACSPFNDVFGFFIQGPGYPTPTNIAKIPGSGLPVTINNIHPDNPIYGCLAFNGQYYNDNNFSNNQPSYDGFTDVFIAEAVVTPCQQYTIKLAIADASDGVFDSGVFLEAKSFGTGSLKVEVATVSSDGTITEGCSQGTITFNLPNAVPQDFPIDYNVWGSALNGIDFQNIPPNLFIPAGQSQLTIPIIAFEDNSAETPEFIAIDVQRDPCNRDTVYIYIRDNGLIPPSLRPDTTVCAGATPLELDATLPITLPPAPTFTNGQDSPIPTNAAPLLSPINVFGVQPTILADGVIRSVCVNITHNWDDDIDMFLLSPGGQFIELSTDNGANADNYTNTCFTPLATTKINFPGPFAPASAAPFTGDWLPEGPWSDLWDGDNPTNGTWKLQVRDDANGFTGTLRDWTITFEPSYKVDYAWTPTAGLDCPTCPIANASPSQTTLYTVIATDSYGCTVVDTVEVVVEPALLAPQVTCGASTSTTITFIWPSVPNANGGYEVNINGTGWVPASGANSHLVTGLGPNSSVTIQVRGINGTFPCDGNIGTATCINCEQPAASANIQGVSCFGLSNGSITLNPDNINPPYSFVLGAQNNITGVFSNLAAGSYMASITDVSGCQLVLPVVVPAPAQLVAVGTVPQQVTCFGGNNGVATVNASGGTGTLDYLWNPSGQATVSAVNLSAGTYTVTVTDDNNCTTTAAVGVVQPPDLVLSAVATAAKCFNEASGSITASGSGGVAPYQFVWSNMVNTPVNPNIPAGGYTVTISDANACAETAFVTVGQAPLLTVTTATVNVLCFGGNNGSATATAAGGTGLYTYKWSTVPQQTSATVTGLQAQIYTVTITDANGCTVTQTATPNAPEVISTTVTKTNADCSGSSDGTATVSASGGAGGFTYKWNTAPQQTTATASNLVAGTYTVTVTDVNGCTSTNSINIGQPTPLQLTATVTDASCFGSTNGQITLAQQGGTAPFGYAWSSGDNSQNISGKAAGPYTVTLSDANGCTLVLQNAITQPEAIVLSVASQSIPCFGQGTGALNLSSSGGTPAYTIAWTGPNGFSGSGSNLNNLFGGAYTVTVTDAEGCATSTSALVLQPASALTLALPDIADTICFLATDGTATAQVSGGTTPYTYIWTGTNQTSATITGLVSNTYAVEVTDANGCMQSGETFIQQKQQLFAVADFKNPNCHDGADGTARLSAIFYGAAAADPNLFSYLWSTTPAQTGKIATGLQAAQSYAVTITDAQGCSAEQTFTLGNPSLVEASIPAFAGVKCNGDANGWAAAEGDGGTAPYHYFWSPGPISQTDSLAQGLAAGLYRVSVIDARGCIAETTVTIGEPAVLKISVLKTDVPCFGQNAGSASAQASGGTSPYQYQWDNGAQTTAIENIAAGVVLLTVTDENGCTQTGSATIRQPAEPLGGAALKTDPACFGGYNGSISITGAGGTPPYRYALDNDPWNGSPLQIAISAGNYVPKIIDVNGCEVTLEPIEVTQPARVQVDLGPDFSIILGRDTQLLASVFNAVEPVEYTWSPEDSTWLSCLHCPDPFVDSLYYQNYFSVVIVDARGCMAEDRIQISVEKPRKIFVPTGFSPNGDLENDLLLVHGQFSAKVLDFRVYDRWGELLYEAKNFPVNDATTGWNGAFRGKDMDPGVYVWVLEVVYMDGTTEVYRGNTTLIR